MAVSRWCGVLLGAWLGLVGPMPDARAEDAESDAEASVPDQVTEGIPLAETVGAEDGRLAVIQNRKYELLNEVSLLGGAMPTDPYYKGIVLTGGYTWHMSPFVAWELAQFTYSLNLDAKLKKELYRIALATGSEAPEFPEINWIIASHLVLKPLYGKEAVFNTEVMHVEAFLQAGPALVKRDEVGRSFAIGVDLGAGMRLWLSDAVSFRVDLGQLVYFLPQGTGKPSEVKQALHLKAGFAFNLRGED